MNKRIPAIRLSLLTSLMAVTALTGACSSQQVTPVDPSTQTSTIESSQIDATPVASDTTDASDTTAVPSIADKTSEPSSKTPESPKSSESQDSPEQLDLFVVDIPSDDSDTLNALEESRPARLVFTFGFDQSQLDDENRLIVEQHGRFLAEHPEVKLVINGHSDTQGSSHYNDILSRKRAEHVADLLMGQGVMKEQIEVLSWGSSAPLVDAHHHREQRRVELNYVDEYLVQSAAE